MLIEYENDVSWLCSASLALFLCVADEDIYTNEPIESDKSLEELRQEPYSLPAGFCWDSVDIDNPIVVSIMSENCKL